ncbi:hypothetical protein [Streptomyces sp. NPDC007172]|uniref:hypothetical protein n=1 Tax=Streptomyces sp. NPDC007172 TaxID=3364776 RepID=UPI00369323BA
MRQKSKAFPVDGAVQSRDVRKRHNALMLPREVGGTERLSDAGQDGPGIGVVEAEPDDGDADVSFTAFEGRVDDGRVMSADQARPMLPVEGQGLGPAPPPRDRRCGSAGRIPPRGRRGGGRPHRAISEPQASPY